MADRPRSTGEDLTPNDAEEQERRDAWLAAFGVAPPKRDDEAAPPPIDAEAQGEMLAFLRGTASPETGKKVIALALRYRSWARRLTDLSFEEARRADAVASDQPTTGGPGEVG